MRGVGLAASFTCSKVLTEAFEFWLHRLAIEAPLRVAGYNQILNVSAVATQALDPPCCCAARARAFDWASDLTGRLRT